MMSEKGGELPPKVETKIMNETPPVPGSGDSVKSIELRDILPEEVELGYRRSPEQERESPFYPKREYLLYKPGEVDNDLLKKICSKHRLTPDTPVLVLPYGETNKIGWETRRLYFALALTDEGGLSRKPLIEDIDEYNYRKLPVTRIISFGNCNVACPYCKRDCQFINEKGVPIISLPLPLSEVARLSEGAVGRNETVRFSGGDPVVYPKQTLALSEYLWDRHKVKISIAHNGTGPKWVEKMLPYLSSAAIDLKAVPEKIGAVMGVASDLGKRMYDSSLKTQGLLSKNQVLLDVRTPIFGDTTLEEMLHLAKDITRVNNLDYTFWTWRLYKPVEGCDWSVPIRENIVEMMERVSQQFPNLWIGMRTKWEKGGMIYLREGRIITRTPDIEEKDIREMGSGNGIRIAV